MQNLYQYERKIKAQIDEQRDLDLKDKWLTLKHEQRDDMILKYKKRIMQFIDKVAKKPREKGDEYSRKLEVAEKSYYKSRVLGEESIRLQHKFESARVNETEMKNKQMLDTVPNEILDKGDPLNLRPRDKGKEIVPPYRSKPRGSIERLYDSMVDKGLSNNTSKIALKSFHKGIKEYKIDPPKAQQSIRLTPKGFLPDLHDKTHFKAAYTIMLNSQSNINYANDEDIRLFETQRQKNEPSSNISLGRFNKSVRDKHGLSRYDSNVALFPQRNNTSDMSLNDRQIEQDMQVTVQNSQQNKESPVDMLIDSYRQKHTIGQDDDYLRYELDKDGAKTVRDNGQGKGKSYMLKHILKPHEEVKHKTQFDQIQNKSKEMMANCSYVRKKHFKSSTLRSGEGSLFMNKGVSNRDYEESILKKSLS